MAYGAVLLAANTYDGAPSGCIEFTPLPPFRPVIATGERPSGTCTCEKVVGEEKEGDMLIAVGCGSEPVEAGELYTPVLGAETPSGMTLLLALWATGVYMGSVWVMAGAAAPYIVVLCAPG